MIILLLIMLHFTLQRYFLFLFVCCLFFSSYLSKTWATFSNFCWSKLCNRCVICCSPPKQFNFYIWPCKGNIMGCWTRTSVAAVFGSWRFCARSLCIRRQSWLAFLNRFYLNIWVFQFQNFFTDLKIADLFATGARDGTICIWDRREPQASVVRPYNLLENTHPLLAPGRALCFFFLYGSWKSHVKNYYLYQLIVISVFTKVTTLFNVECLYYW